MEGVNFQQFQQPASNYNSGQQQVPGSQSIGPNMQNFKPQEQYQQPLGGSLRMNNQTIDPSSANNRPMSRGNRVSNNPGNLGGNHQAQALPNGAFAISSDQQAFQLPAGNINPNNNNNNGGGGGNYQPQFHFIANQQKFYAQITPDKAPLLFSNEKRPFTAAHNENMMMGGSNNNNNNVKSHSQSKTGRQNNQSHGGNSHNKAMNGVMPYLQMASKTHTGSFPLNSMQIAASNNNGATSKYVSSTGNLDTQSINSNPHPSHLVSLFTQQNHSNPIMIMQQSQQQQQHVPQIKVSKIKPNRNNIKEKEQLYEDAIKLKIQSNSYREENIKLKTKIKILENEMQKKEKAIEDFMIKFSTTHTGQSHHNPSVFYPSQQALQTLKPQAQLSSPLPLNNNFMMQTAQKLQSETFLVISLKKQLKDSKIELQKKEEDLEILKKNIKSTQKQESEVEIKTYKEELARMRQLLEEMMKEGPSHPLFQKQSKDKIQQLEIIRQQQEIRIKQLQQENSEIQTILKNKEDEKVKKVEDKEKKSSELSKLKKLLREKDKEIIKVKAEIAKKPIAFDQPSQLNQQISSNTTAINAAQNQPNPKSTDDFALKQAQKKLKEAQTELKSKKEKLEEQDSVIKRLQERLQGKIEELDKEAKQSKTVQEELQKLKKEKELDENLHKQIEYIEDKLQKEVQSVLLQGQVKQIGYEDLIKKVKSQNDSEIHVPPKLKDKIKGLSDKALTQIFNRYTLMKPYQLESKVNFVLTLLAKNLKSMDSLSLAGIDTFDDFKDEIEENLIDKDDLLSKGQWHALKLKYYQALRKEEDSIGFDSDKFLEDLRKLTQINDEKQQMPQKKKSRPQTAKSNQSLQNVNHKSNQSLKQIEEDKEDGNDIYEDDFEENNKKDKKVIDIDQEPAQPTIKKQSDAGDAKKIQQKDDSKLVEEEEDKKQDADAEVQRYMDEEEMLDIAEHCFIRIAEMLLESNRSARLVFTKYSIPEQFPDGTILELMSPIAFLEGVKEAGMEDLSEMEAACLLRVLAKPELENAIILNEFIMIMENFGVIDNFEDDDDIDDYIKSEDEEEESKSKVGGGGDEQGEDAKKEEVKGDKEKSKRDQASSVKKKRIQINFDKLEDKGLKILQKLARFLLERYLHPREFFGPAIYKQLVKTKKRENNVDILQTKDFYLRLKIAGIRKTVKEVENLNSFLCLDSKFPHLMQVKKVVKALEEVAQGEQLKLQEEIMRKQQEEEEKHIKTKGGAIIEEEEDYEEDEDEEEGDIGEDEKKQRKAQRAKELAESKKITGNNQDLIRETGIGSLGLMGSSSLTGGPHSIGYRGMGSLDYGMRPGAPSSKMAMLMGFNHLNTIEEEKHETQTSNYFKDGADSERDDSKYIYNTSNILGKGSRILDEDGHFLDQSGSNKQSPQRHDFQSNNGQVQEELEDEEYDENNLKESPIQHKADPDKKQDLIEDEEEYEEDEDEDQDQERNNASQIQQRVASQDKGYDTENPRIETERDKSINDMKSVQSVDNYDDDIVQDDQDVEEDKKDNDDESDYEF